MQDDVNPVVSIIIVNWNSGDYLSRCIDSMRDSLGSTDAPTYEAIVVDNGSKDNSIARIALRPNEHVIRNIANHGFGAACNQAARQAQGEFILLLNPDCELRAGSLERCIDALALPQAGICGVALEDESGQIARSCHRFPGFGDLLASAIGLNSLWHTRFDSRMLKWDHRSDRTVDHVIGAFYLMRRSLFERVGGFDERFFVYLEDLDLSLRVRQLGFATHFVARPPSFHVGGGVSRQIKATRLFYATRSRLLYAFKHLPQWQAWVHAVVTLCVEPWARSAQALAFRSFGSLADSWRGFFMLYRDLPAILRKS
jgi:GT2 family glycosyltransferase